jgi:hypothetical protein
MKQPPTPTHSRASHKGSLVLSGDALLVPGGRSVPACYDRRTGKMMRYQLAENGKRGGARTSLPSATSSSMASPPSISPPRKARRLRPARRADRGDRLRPQNGNLLAYDLATASVRG